MRADAKLERPIAAPKARIERRREGVRTEFIAAARTVIEEHGFLGFSFELVAERIAIASYSEIVRWLADKDITTRRLMEDILAVEEEHADDLLNFLKNFGVAL